MNRVGIKMSMVVGALLFTGCIVSEKKMNQVSRKSFSGNPASEWVYVPEYYVYKDGRYRFINGYYRKVSPEQYWKRVLRGSHPGN